MTDEDVIPLCRHGTSRQQARSGCRNPCGPHCFDKISPCYTLLPDLFFPHIFTSVKCAEKISITAVKGFNDDVKTANRLCDFICLDVC
jgi:hypothetical protein